MIHLKIIIVIIKDIISLSFIVPTKAIKTNIVVSNTYPIGTDGTVKVYVVDGGVLNGKELTGSGWTTINILDYM